MSNSLSRLGVVLNSSQRTIVTIIQVNANGTTLVEHSDSSRSIVIGNSVESGAIYIENGRVLGSAPLLPFYEITV
tara:strand:- start:814 stop:1038 length:225 start_codon:yes stop_codon:yes gene_type:complete